MGNIKNIKNHKIKGHEWILKQLLESIDNNFWGSMTIKFESGIVQSLKKEEFKKLVMNRWEL